MTDIDRITTERLLKSIDEHQSEIPAETNRMLIEAEQLKLMLDYCIVSPGATISVTIEHDSGAKSTAKLYDLAAFVTSLYDALEYFQSELIF